EAMLDIDVKSKPSQPHWFERYVQPCVAELLGTALFVFTGCISVVDDTPNTGKMQPALVHGLAAGVIVAALGDI
ncbi:AQP8 protein, partial [Ceuthmochares aereus]|nr:AQP8 protein [Ceuthmochares aereus]